MSTGVSNTKNDPKIENISFDNTFTDTKIGEAIRSVNADEISLIAGKMKSVLSNSVTIDEKIQLKIALAEDDFGIGHLLVNAKGEYLEKSANFFKQIMTNDFQHGLNSNLYYCSSIGEETKGGYLHNYAHSSLLHNAIAMGLVGLREAIGNQLPSNYHIILYLNLPETKKENKLVFVVKELVDMETTSTTSFTLEALQKK